MTTLKDLTAEKHKEAESHPFVKILFSGEIEPQFYATYLYNLHTHYNHIEVYSAMHYLTKDLPSEWRRADLINEDYKELWNNPDSTPKLLESTTPYMDHIRLLDQINPNEILAHLYVRHMGDLAGGQMIAKKVPGSGRMYKFNDPNTLKAKIRDLVTVEHADEANRCFDFAIKMFSDMMKLDMPKTVSEVATFVPATPIADETLEMPSIDIMSDVNTILKAINESSNG